MSNNRNNDGMPEETMQTDELNADSFGDGMIEIGDTRLPDAVIRVQKEVDAIGWLGADMRVIGMAYFRNPDVFWKRRVPEKLNLHEKRIDGHERRMPNSRRARAVDMSAIRRDCPINHDTTAELFMSYRQNEDGRIVVDETDRSAYWGVMRHAEASCDGLLADPDAPIVDPWKSDGPEVPGRDPGLLALWDRISGLVIPLPSRSLLIYRFWKSGMGVDLYVVDEESLRIQQHNHPECFDESADERLIQREIDVCEAELAYVIGHNINLRQHPDAYENVGRKETLQ